MNKSYLEISFLQQIRWAGLPEPETEFRACPPRRYRWDLAYPKTKLLIEVQGGIWHKSAHSTGVGISRDYEKNNVAVANGWRVLYFSADMVHSGKALEIIEKELRKEMNEMKISDDRLNEIIDKMQIQYQNAPEFDRNFEKDVHDCLLELRSIRNYYAMEEESKRLESQRLCDIERRIEIEGE